MRIGSSRTLSRMSHQGPERDRQRSQREGSLSDFLGWRAREHWPALVLACFFLPPASLVGAAVAVRDGDVFGALGLLAIGAVSLIWLFLPVLTQRYLLRRARSGL
jgi:hypothetical protein